MTVNITPPHDRVLVRRLEEEETAKDAEMLDMKNLKWRG
jgi:co-chaperonin GroES (HSP10)